MGCTFQNLEKRRQNVAGKGGQEATSGVFCYRR